MRTIDRPGKFEGETALTVYAYDVEMGGCADDYHADYSIIYGPFVVDDVVDVVREMEPTLVPFTDDERETVDKTEAVILFHRSDGFVCGTIYTDRAEADADWNRIVAETLEEED